MASTPNFGWNTPADTDLVKDGALAIRTLGNAIDASMVDLKGGTTGQVLAKQTNTDMDFQWVTQDDANAIQNAIVDAKGDLIAATANDTPARLAVGANDTVLVADSAQSTGLKWSGNWQTYSPVIGNLTIGNGTANYRYAQIGKTVFVDINITFGSTTSLAGTPNISLPVAIKYSEAFFACNLLDSGAANYSGGVLTKIGAYSYIDILTVNTSGTYAYGIGISATVPFTWTTNDQINVQFSYEAA